MSSKRPRDRYLCDTRVLGGIDVCIGVCKGKGKLSANTTKQDISRLYILYCLEILGLRENCVHLYMLL